ncbi:hypothetical protein V8E52_010982 [Russula decolorans]
MEPSPEPPPPNPNPNETTPISADLPPDTPPKRTVFRVTFPDPDPIRAVPKDYFPSRESLGTYVGQLKEELQTLVQGPLDFRLASFLSSWKGSNLGVRETEFENAAHLTIAVLDAGPYPTSKITPPLEAEDWGTLASACLAAIARGFSRPLTEATRKTYTAFWEGIEDNPQRKLDDGENSAFHSLLQRLKATTQHLDMHINADETDGLRRWTSTSRKEIEEAARCAALAELTVRQQQLEEDLKRTILERNVELFRTTANTLGLTIGDPTTTPHSRPIPSTGGKCTLSGSAPHPTRAPQPPSLPSIPDIPLPQVPSLDVVTLTAAVQTAMQPFMARLAAIESLAATKNLTRTETTAPRLNQVQADKQARPLAGQPASDPNLTDSQPHPPEDWVQATSKRKRGKKGKLDQANPTLQQINLTPRSYATVTGATVATAATSQVTAQPPAQNQLTLLANPPPAFTEITVVRQGGSMDFRKEQATQIRKPDAIVREVRANMTRAVAKPLPIIAGRWSSGTRSRGNFVFTMRGQVDFAFIQTFEHFLTGPFPGGGQLLGIITGWAYPRVWRAGFRRGGCGFEISTHDPTLTHSAGWRALFDAALQDCKDKTGNTLIDHPIAKQLETCESVNSTAAQTLGSFLAAFLLLDFIDSAIKLIPGVGNPFGGSIFFLARCASVTPSIFRCHVCLCTQLANRLMRRRRATLCLFYVRGSGYHWTRGDGTKPVFAIKPERPSFSSSSRMPAWGVLDYAVHTFCFRFFTESGKMKVKKCAGMYKGVVYTSISIVVVSLPRSFVEPLLKFAALFTRHLIRSHATSPHAFAFAIASLLVCPKTPNTTTQEAIDKTSSRAQAPPRLRLP